MDRRSFFQWLWPVAASAPLVAAAEPAWSGAIDIVTPQCPCGNLLSLHVTAEQLAATGGDYTAAMLQPRRLSCSCGWSGIVTTARRI